MHLPLFLYSSILGAVVDACLALAAPGDWFKVEKLVREMGGDDTQLVNAWNKIGQYYSDRHKWGKAAQYYTSVRACMGAVGLTSCTPVLRCCPQCPIHVPLPCNHHSFYK